MVKSIFDVADLTQTELQNLISLGKILTLGMFPLFYTNVLHAFYDVFMMFYNVLHALNGFDV